MDLDVGHLSTASLISNESSRAKYDSENPGWGSPEGDAVLFGDAQNLREGQLR